MSHIIHLSDERYQAVAALAAAFEQTPEDYINSLIAEKVREEEEYTRVDAAFANDPEWITGAHEAVEQVKRGESRFFATTEEFMRHLGADDQELAAIRRIEQGDSDADA